MTACGPPLDAAFTHLKGIKRLNIGHCPKLVLKNCALKGIEWLNMDGHSKASFEVVEALGYHPLEMETMGLEA